MLDKLLKLSYALLLTVILIQILIESNDNSKLIDVNTNLTEMENKYITE